MTPYFQIGLYATILFFIYFCIIFPGIGFFEKSIYDLYMRSLQEKGDKTIHSGTRLYGFSIFELMPVKKNKTTISI